MKTKLTCVEMARTINRLERAIREFQCPTCQGSGLETRQAPRSNGFVDTVTTHCETCFSLREALRGVSR